VIFTRLIATASVRAIRESANAGRFNQKKLPPRQATAVTGMEPILLWS
jgi:hypothetical protein